MCNDYNYKINNHKIADTKYYIFNCHEYLDNENLKF